MNRRHVPRHHRFAGVFWWCSSCSALAALIVYGVPYVAERTGYAWEAGRSQADVGGPGEA